MYNESDSSVKIVSYSNDQMVDGQGTLIPRKGDFQFKYDFTPKIKNRNFSRAVTRVGVSFFGIFALLIIGTSGYGYISESNMVASPIVTIIDENSKAQTTLEYKEQKSFQVPAFFEDTRDAFIDKGLTFIEVDMENEQLRFFKEGVLFRSDKIVSQGEKGSWWGISSGLYKVEKMEKKPFSVTGQVYLPWLITFQGNYFIHGIPTYPNNTEVAEDFTAGGIRLDNKSAKSLFESVKVGTPVLVHTIDEPDNDSFVYEPQVPDISTKNYYIADLENGTILASSEVDAVLPIASLTKLMTAIIATERISLDERVLVTSPTFVESLIPRLSERGSVSMYSLLQLLLIESSNEAAETIAGEIGRDEFLKAMNDKARQLGMMKTYFADPSGVSSENVSSIEDLYLLTNYIYDNKKFIFDITASKELGSVYSEEEFEGLVNFNEIRDTDSFIGGKVGETDAAGQTSISLHKMQFNGEDRVLAIILLGSSGRTKDVETLIYYLQNRFSR